MEIVYDLVTLVAGLLGLTPETFIALVFGAASGKLTYWLTNQADKLFTQWGIFAEAWTGRIKGTVMTIANAILALAVVFLGGLVFGVNYFTEESVFVGIVGALGVNQNVAQWIFHKVKAKRPAAGAGS